MIIGEMCEANKVVGISDITLRAVWFSIMIIAMEIYSFKFIDNIIFQELGKKSYTIYLIQFMVISAFDEITGLTGDTPKAWFCKWVSVMVITYLLAVVIEKLVTNPIYNKLVKIQQLHQ